MFSVDKGYMLLLLEYVYRLQARLSPEQDLQL